MKKLFAIVLAAIALLMLGACRAESNTGEATSATQTNTNSETTDTSSSTTDSSSTSTTTEADVNADEEAFVQTGEVDEDVTVTIAGADPSTIVVDFGDLVTLHVYSERLKPTQLYNEDLMVDQTVSRGETVTLTIEANEEGIFYVTDKLTGDQLLRFMVASMSIGQNN